MTNLQAYEAALNSAAYFFQPQAGFIRLSGDDRLDFLQRQTTNDLRQLTSDRTVSTVLTSPTARILDVFCLVDEGETLGVLTLPGRFLETSKFLRSRIFFSDQVAVEDVSKDYAQVFLLGPKAEDILESFDLRPKDKEFLKSGQIDNQLVMIISQRNLGGSGYRLLCPITSVNLVLTGLNLAGATALDIETFNILRVEAGQPGPDGELIEAHTPLEVNLDGLISDSKGCYTGQEIIARQITYDKVAKNMVPIKISRLVDIGAKIEVDGKSAGMLTSMVQSPRFGAIGLAVVRRLYREAGERFSVLGSGDNITTGEVVELPFS